MLACTVPIESGKVGVTLREVWRSGRARRESESEKALKVFNTSWNVPICLGSPYALKDALDGLPRHIERLDKF